MSADPVVRSSRPEDPVSRVLRAAFAEEGDLIVSLWAEVEHSDALRGSLVAEMDGEVGGHVGLSHAWLDARRELVDVWMLAPLAVAPAHQGRGAGTRLVAAAIEQARTGGAPLLFLEGDPGYYGARGFEPARALGFLPASARTPGPGFQVARFDGHEDWMTGQVIYRDVWWRHDTAGVRDPLLGELEERWR